MAGQLWFEDLHVGDEFSAPDVVVDDAAFAAFASLTGDAHPMHYDESFSKTTRFGKPVAHGLHLLALTALGATTITDEMRDTVIAFTSVSATFMGPVFPGNTLSRRASVLSLKPRNAGQGWVVMHAELRRGDEVVLDAEHIYLWKRRPD